MTPNPRLDADPQQRRFAVLFRAGQSQRSAFRDCGGNESRQLWSCRASIATAETLSVLQRHSAGLEMGSSSLSQASNHVHSVLRELGIDERYSL
jgi:hypothetical protein